MASVRGRASPSNRITVDRRTTAWTIADSPKPTTSAQRISQVIDPAMANACTIASNTLLNIPTGGISDRRRNR
jgi:hypothetical protein